MNKQTGIAGIHSGAALKEEWLTPRYIQEPLGIFDLDPCAAINQPWRTAQVHLTINHDGLSKPWHGRVWLNPPYGRKTGEWLARLADHGNGIALIFARTETEMFFEHVWNKADALLFIEGRIHFCHANGTPARANAGGPSVLVAYGLTNVGILRNCSIKGKFIRLEH